MATMGAQHYPDNIKETRNHEAQKITDIHLNSDLANEWQANSSKTYVTTFCCYCLIYFAHCLYKFHEPGHSPSHQPAKEVA